MSRPATRAAQVINNATFHPFTIFGIVGLLGNAVSITLLASSRSTNLNLRAAFLEVLNDALGSVAVGSETPGQAESTEIVMVGTGDTLWGIASELNGDGDVRSTMREIERLNALDSAALSAGQKLRVPVSDD